jgi:hypothetical protein
MAGQELMWLDERFGEQLSFCVTFVRGTDERGVLVAFGADPDETVPRSRLEAEIAEGSWDQGYGPFVRVGRCGEWLFAWEQASSEGSRPEVLRRVSVGAEAVALRNCLDGFAEFGHAADGDVITSVATIVPYSRGGSDPDRFLPLIREVGLDFEAAPGGQALPDLQAVLTVAQRAFGLSLGEPELERPLPSARILPVLPELPARRDVPARSEGRVPAIGDPEIDQLLLHADEQTLAAAVGAQVRGMLADSGLDASGELVQAADAALAEGGQPVADDSPAGVVLRRTGREKYEAEMDDLSPRPHLTQDEQRQRTRRAAAARVLLLVLAWGPRPALPAVAHYRRRWGAPGWRDQFLHDLAPPDRRA